MTILRILHRTVPFALLILGLFACSVSTVYGKDCSDEQKADARAYVNDGLRAEVEGDPITALRHYRAALNFCPEMADAHLRIGIISLGRKECTGGSIRDSIGHLTTYIENSQPEKKAIALRFLIRYYIQEHKLKDANEILAEYRQINPEHPSVNFFANLLLLSDSSKIDRIITNKLRMLAKNSAIDPMEVMLLNRSLIRIKIGDKAEYFIKSQELLEQLEGGAIPEECKDAGQCLSHIRKSLIHVLESHPDFNLANILLGKTYVVLGPGRDIHKAERYFKKAYDLPKGKLELVKLYYLKDELQKADNVAKALLKQYPKSPEANYWLGCVRLLQARVRESAQLFVKSYLIDPESPVANSSIKKIIALDPELKMALKSLSAQEVKQVKAGLDIIKAQSPKSGLRDVRSFRYGAIIETENQKKLELIVNRIVTSAVLPDDEYGISVLDTDRIQALAVDEGSKKKIYLTRGFLDFIEEIQTKEDDDSLLAFVIAHELAHLVLGHNRTVEIIASTVSEKPSNAKISKQIIRAQEQEADQQGLHYSFLAGFNPNGSLLFMKEFAERFKEAPFDDNHPTFSQRSRALVDYWNTVAYPAYLNFSKGLLSIKNGNRAERHGNPKAIEDYKQGAKDFQRFLTLFPTSKQGHNNLGFCFMKIALWGLVFKKEFTFDPWRLSMVYDPAVFEFKRIGLKAPGMVDDPEKYLEQASREFNKALELDPKFPEAFVNYGIYLLLKDHRKKAEEHFEKGLKSKSTTAACLNNLGVMMASERNWSRAQTYFENALKIDQTLPESLYNLCVVYKKTGQKTKAFSVSKDYFKVEKTRSGWRKILSYMLEIIAD